MGTIPRKRGHDADQSPTLIFIPETMVFNIGRKCAFLCSFIEFIFSVQQIIIENRLLLLMSTNFQHQKVICDCWRGSIRAVSLCGSELF